MRKYQNRNLLPVSDTGMRLPEHGTARPFHSSYIIIPYSAGKLKYQNQKNLPNSTFCDFEQKLFSILSFFMVNTI